MRANKQFAVLSQQTFLVKRVLLGLCLVVPTSWLLYLRVNHSKYLVLASIALSDANRSVCIEYVRVASDILPEPLCLRVTTSRKTFFLDTINQLEGLVLINNSQEALTMARIPSHYHYAMPFPWEIEIQSGRTDTQSGLKGPSALPLQLFKACGFTSAVVTSDKSGYLITRWIFVQQQGGGGTVQKIRELVGKNGSYRRTILVDKPPPNLPNVEWGIPYRL